MFNPGCASSIFKKIICVPLKRTLNLMCIFRILKKSLIASTKALIYFTIRSGVASVDNWRGEYSYIVFCLTNFFLKSIFLMVFELKYMNIRPSTYRRWLRH